MLCFNFFIDRSSASLRRKTTSSNLERDIDPGRLTGILFDLLLGDRFICLMIAVSLGCHLFGFVLLIRQERFVNRWVDALSDPRATHEIRSIWISYWSQVVAASSCFLSLLFFCFNDFEVGTLYLLLDLFLNNDGMNTQADKSLGQKLASRLNVRPNM